MEPPSLFPDPDRCKRHNRLAPCRICADEARMTRATDPITSGGAAAVIAPTLGRIQRMVLEAYRTCGPMTARTAERLPCFGAYGFSTIRKRISELQRAGILTVSGVDTSSKAPATIYSAAADAAG